MKTIALLFLLTMYVSNSFSQTAKNAKKVITSGTNPLYKSNKIMVQSQLDVENDSITSYKLKFSIADLSLLATDTNASSHACLLTDKQGTVYNGILDIDLSTPLPTKVYTCSFTKDDFYKITAQKIVQIEINASDGNGGIFSVDKKLQNNIAQQGNALLSQMNSANPQ